MNRRLLNVVLPALVWLTWPANAPAEVPNQTRQFWFSGVDPAVQGDRHVDTPRDYMDLFKPDAPWAVGASGTTAFKISTQLVSRRSRNGSKISVASSTTSRWTNR